MGVERGIIRSDIPVLQEGSPRNETARSGAFRVRGHHLGRVRWLQKHLVEGSRLRRSANPFEIMADFELQDYLEMRRVALASIKKNGPNEKDGARLRYVNDMVGHTEADFTAFKERAVEFFQQFDNLGENDDVEVVVSGDTLCRTIPQIGDHCPTASVLYGEEGTSRKNRDKHGIYLLRKDISNLGLEDQVEAFYEMTDYVDAPNTEELCLRMKAPVFKRILVQSSSFEMSVLQDA